MRLRFLDILKSSANPGFTKNGQPIWGSTDQKNLEKLESNIHWINKHLIKLQEANAFQ